MAIDETSDTTGVPAVRGANTAQGDGVWGECGAGRGVVGVSSGGTGVWGHTVSGRGVVGVNNEEGTGVWGETKRGRGVVGVVQTDGDGAWGECSAGRGVVGVSKTGAGVWGHTASGRGVVGVNEQEGTGVWGETQSGRGVVGISRDDIGVFGKGGRLAALFEGNVEVLGSLTVQGIDILTWIRRIRELEPVLAELAAARAARPVIQVSQITPIQRGVALLVVKGERFRPGQPIKINFTSPHPELGGGTTLVHNTGGDGRLESPHVGVRAFAGAVYSVVAVDGEISSNTVTLTCV